MPYDIRLTQINANLGGLGRANTAWGFPANTNFHTLLMSYWTCGPVAPPGTGTGACAIYANFSPAGFFNLVRGTDGIVLTNQTRTSTTPFYTGTFTQSLSTQLRHVLFSVDTHSQTVQLYVNDQNVPITGETWDGPPPFDFNLADSTSIWNWNVAGVISSGQHPALADAWITNPPSFVDLNVTANRRKFINSNLTPVDLGDTGTTPFGYQPALYMSVRPGGIPDDLLLNRGVGGGAWGYSGGVAPTFQAPGVCTLPVPPPIPTKLAMDDVVVIATTTQLSSNLVSLRWSDDRGHTFGSPVTQSIGEVGEYRTSLQWQRLGMSRDRVFEVSWSVPMPIALQGAWFDAQPAQS